MNFWLTFVNIDSGGLAIIGLVMRYGVSHDDCGKAFRITSCWWFEIPWPDIAKSTGPRSSTSKNSGGPMKTLIVAVWLSSKEILGGSPSLENLVLN